MRFPRHSRRCICLAAVLLAACARDALPPAAAPSSAAPLVAAPLVAKNESLALNARWSELAVNVPESLGALHARLDSPRAPGGRKLMSSGELTTARAELNHAESLWSKAQAAFATGNLPEAVTTASAAGATLDGLAGLNPRDNPH